MSKWVRLILALIAGIFAAGLCVALIEMLAHRIVTGQAVFIVAAFGLGIAAFVGGSIATRISKVSQFAWVIAAVLALLSLVNVVSFSHPIWFVPVAAIALALGAFSAIRWYNSRTA